MDDQLERESGVSLLGLLVVLVILGALGGMAAVGVSRLADNPGGTSARLGDLGAAGGLADGVAVPGAAQGRSGSPFGAPNTAACTATVQSIERAAATKHATDGAFPASVSDLVAGGWLSEAPALRGYDLTMETTGGRPTGKVLVNGLPAGQGCASQPRPGP